MARAQNWFIQSYVQKYIYAYSAIQSYGQFLFNLYKNTENIFLKFKTNTAGKIAEQNIIQLKQQQQIGRVYEIARE